MLPQCQHGTFDGRITRPGSPITTSHPLSRSPHDAQRVLRTEPRVRVVRGNAIGVRAPPVLQRGLFGLVFPIAHAAPPSASTAIARISSAVWRGFAQSFDPSLRPAAITVSAAR